MINEFLSPTVFTFLCYFLIEDEQGKINRKGEEENIFDYEVGASNESIHVTVERHLTNLFLMFHIVGTPTPQNGLSTFSVGNSRWLGEMF